MDGLNAGRVCVCGGCWAQNSTPSVVDHSEANGAFPSSILQSTRLQCSRRRLRWINEANAADQNKLIILNFISTRTFSNYNVERATHGRIHYKFVHSVVENTVDMTSMTSNENQGPVPWIKRLDILHLTSPVACKKRGADQRNTIIMELEGFGSRKRTIYCAKRTWVSTVYLVECLLGIFCCVRLKVFLVYRGPTGSVPWTAVGFVFLELLK